MNPHEIIELWSLGRASWPAFAVSEEQHSAYVMARPRLLAQAKPTQSLADDVYLACGCTLAMEAAIESFVSRHSADMARGLSPMGLPTDLREEVKQAVLTKLFVGSGSGGAQIGKYSGSGSLGAWMRVVTVRTALDILRREKKDEVGVDEPILEALAEADLDPDLRVIKSSYRELANEAFESGFAKLTSRQRNLLRQHYIHQLDIDQLSSMYSVHRATAFRWIAKARASVFAQARDHVAKSVGEEAEEADDLLRLLESQIDVSLDRLLRSTMDDSPEPLDN